MNTEIMLQIEDESSAELSSMGVPMTDATVNGDNSGRSPFSVLIKEVIDFCFYSDDEYDPYPLGYESATLFLYKKKDE